MNAPGQLNSFHLASYDTYLELLKTQNITKKKEKKERKLKGKYLVFHLN